MTNSRLRPLGVALGLITGLAGPALHAQHGHLNAGAAGQQQDDPLILVNGGDFAADSGYVKSLDWSDTGRYANTYNGSIAFTAFHSFDTNGVPLPNGPAAGSFIRAEILSVTGPAGGSFSFWENDGNAAPWITLDSGFSGTSTAWAISDASLGAGQPGGDAFGHLHGRRFSSTVWGDYAVTFRFFDASDNGAGGGPIHAPADPITIRFSTVPEPSVLGLGLLGGGLAWWFRRRRA